MKQGVMATGSPDRMNHHRGGITIKDILDQIWSKSAYFSFAQIVPSVWSMGKIF